MPKNILTETDATGRVLQVNASNTVFIPIEVKTTAAGPFLFTTEAELAAKFSGDLPETTTLEYSAALGYKLARHLLASGLTVLVQGITVAMTDNQWLALEDRNQYDIRFLTNGAIKAAGVVQKMIDCAANRGDCTALVDFDESVSNFDYTLGTIQAKVTGVTKGQYAAAFTPAFYTKNGHFITDDVAEVLIPSAFGYVFAYASSIKNNPEWLAIAGFDRGVIPELSRVAHKYSTADVNALQKRSDTEADDNVGIAINAIAYIRPAGYIIYGNRTLRANEATKKLTATSFLNVRNMISLVKKIAYDAANKFTFEQNSEKLWVNYKSYITPTLDRITHGDGALGYSINKIKTDAKATLEAEIIIQPIEAVEDILLGIIMTDTTTAVAEQ